MGPHCDGWWCVTGFPGWWSLSEDQPPRLRRHTGTAATSATQRKVANNLIGKSNISLISSGTHWVQEFFVQLSVTFVSLEVGSSKWQASYHIESYQIKSIVPQRAVIISCLFNQSEDHQLGFRQTHLIQGWKLETVPLDHVLQLFQLLLSLAFSAERGREAWGHVSALCT